MGFPNSQLGVYLPVRSFFYGNETCSGKFCTHTDTEYSLNIIAIKCLIIQILWRKLWCGLSRKNIMERRNPSASLPPSSITKLFATSRIDGERRNFFHAAKLQRRFFFVTTYCRVVYQNQLLKEIREERNWKCTKSYRGGGGGGYFFPGWICRLLFLLLWAFFPT